VISPQVRSISFGCLKFPAAVFAPAVTAGWRVFFINRAKFNAFRDKCRGGDKPCMGEDSDALLHPVTRSYLRYIQFRKGQPTSRVGIRSSSHSPTRPIPIMQRTKSVIGNQGA
jgi:hypothetical protein